MPPLHPRDAFPQLTLNIPRAFPKLGITNRAALRDALASTPQHDDRQRAG